MKWVSEHIEDERFAYLDGELPERRAREIAGHLENCSHCRNEISAAQRTHAALSSAISMTAAPEDFTFSVLLRISQDSARTGPWKEALGQWFDKLRRLAWSVSGNRFAIPAAGLVAFLLVALLIPSLLSGSHPILDRLNPFAGVDSSAASKWPPPRWTTYHPAYYGSDFSLEKISNPFDVTTSLAPEDGALDILGNLGPKMPGGNPQSAIDASHFGDQFYTLDQNHRSSLRPKGRDEAAQRQRNQRYQIRTVTPLPDQTWPTSTPRLRPTLSPTPVQATSTPIPSTPTPVSSPTATPTAVQPVRVVFIPSDIPGRAGEGVLVPVSVSELNGIASADLSIHYDRNILEYRACSPSQNTEGFLISRNPGTSGILKVSLSRNQPITSNGPGNLLLIEFRIQDTVQSGVISDINPGRALLFDADGSPIGLTVRRGSVVVE